MGRLLDYCWLLEPIDYISLAEAEGQYDAAKDNITKGSGKP